MNAPEPCPACQLALGIMDRELKALRVLLNQELKALRVLLNQREKTVDARFMAQSAAAQLVAEGIRSQFEGTNEWRAQLDRERLEFAKIATVDAVKEHLERMDRWQSKLQGGLMLASALGGLSLILTLVKFVRS